MADITFVAPGNLTVLSQLTGTSVVLVDASGNALAKMSTDTFKEIVKLEQIDGVPTEGSTNAVSSGGVYDALEEKQDALVGGQNIKNVDGSSLLGAGNIVIGVQEINVSATVSGTAPNYTFVLNNYADFYNAIVAAKTAGKTPVSRLVIGQGSSAITLIGLISNKTSTTFNTSFQDSGTGIYMCEFNSPSAATPYKIEYVEQQEKLTFDDTPTAGSTNPVKSTGVKSAVDAVRRSFYEAAGAVYNATTGYYELNGLTDITEAQMAEIYAIGRGFNFGKDNDYKFAYQRLRTNLLPITSNTSNCGVYTAYNANNAVSCRCMFAYTNTFEVVVVGIGKTGTEMGLYPLDASSMFINCPNLRTVLGVLKMKYCDTVSGMFTGCSSLRTIKLSGVKINNISFADSPLLYYSSLFYLVDNASNTTAITVTVHADVYAKLTRTYEGSVMTKIQQEANETGQDATTLAQQWASLSSTAANKNISFAEP